MSFTLMDSGSESFELRANVWSWKPTIEIIKSFDVLSDGKLRQMEYNGTGVKLDKEEAHLIGEKIRDKILPQLEPNKRMFMDLTVTDKPDDGTLHKDADDQWKNYSASYDFLKEFSEFCLNSKGFQIY